MKLKESYRYQNFLNSLIGQAERILSSNITKEVTETHYISKAVPTAKNEVKVIPPAYEYDPNHVIDLIMELIQEKQDVTDAISEAKKYADIDIDAAMDMNKAKQNFVSYLETLDAIKPTEVEEQVRGYAMNKEGTEQIPVYYNRKSVTAIRFDRNMVRGLIKKLSKECDETSTKKDLADLTVEVEFTPKFEFTDKLDTLLS